LLLVLASALVPGSEFHRSHGHSLLSHCCGRLANYSVKDVEALDSVTSSEAMNYFVGVWLEANNVPAPSLVSGTWRMQLKRRFRSWRTAQPAR
jgi:hypothetical protein